MDDSLPPEDKPKRPRIPREAWRQEKAVVFVREAVRCPYTFMAFDRSEKRNARSHLFEAKRGVRPDTPDSLLIARIPGGQTWHVWAEWKAPGQRPGEGQLDALERLRGLGDHATWCVTIDEYRLFLAHCGVPLVANAEYLAMHYDGMVDSRIAKAEGRVVPVVKKSRSRKPGPRFTAGKRMARRIWGT
jgi:hypothetical protein